MFLKNNKFESYLLFLFPPALVTGPFLPDLILSIASIFFLFKLYINKNLNFLNNDFFKIFVVFYIFIVLRSLASEEILFSLKNSFFYFRFVLFSYLIKYLILNEKHFLKHFIFVLFGVLLLISIDAIVEYSSGSHWLFDKNSYPEFINNYRISGLFDEEYILGGFVLVFMGVVLFYFKEFHKNNKFLKIFLFLSFFVFAIAVIISGERVSFVKLIILLISASLFTSIFINKKNQIIFFFVVIITILLALYSQPKLKDRIVFHTLNLVLQINPENKISNDSDLINFFKNEEYKDFKITYFSSEHKDHALISIKMFNENKLFGKGIKMFRIFCSKKENYVNERACTTHSHNILLTFVSELGIIGLIFLLMIYFFLIKNIYKSHSNTQRMLLLSIFIYLLPGIPSGYFFNNFFSMILYTLVGIYLGDKKNNLISYD